MERVLINHLKNNRIIKSIFDKDIPIEKTMSIVSNIHCLFYKEIKKVIIKNIFIINKS